MNLFGTTKETIEYIYNDYSTSEPSTQYSICVNVVKKNFLISHSKL